MPGGPDAEVHAAVMPTAMEAAARHRGSRLRALGCMPLHHAGTHASCPGAWVRRMPGWARLQRGWSVLAERGRRLLDEGDGAGESDGSEDEHGLASKSERSWLVFPLV